MAKRPGPMTSLAARVRNAPAQTKTVDAAIARMEQIQKERSTRFTRRTRRAPWHSEELPDGVACFNRLYLLVTRTVTEHLRNQPASGPPAFKAPAFVNRLIPIFAHFYFQAYEGAQASDGWLPRS